MVEEMRMGMVLGGEKGLVGRGGLAGDDGGTSAADSARRRGGAVDPTRRRGGAGGRGQRWRWTPNHHRIKQPPKKQDHRRPPPTLHSYSMKISTTSEVLCGTLATISRITPLPLYYSTTSVLLE
uniref:Uncharacterized protein n=1 Tax=Setaria viridis TaxID=4556 RepID=A0A4U6WCC3_SETVI|nr:hypothetical protein SEVIR_1G128700v2 [Setaria viridis]